MPPVASSAPVVSELALLSQPPHRTSRSGEVSFLYPGFPVSDGSESFVPVSASSLDQFDLLVPAVSSRKGHTGFRNGSWCFSNGAGVWGLNEFKLGVTKSDAIMKFLRKLA